jgi:two-component system cell cycle sensor histidine kinase/response regulator CckA
MKQKHSLLRRQLKKFFGSSEDIPELMNDFIEAVNDAYEEFDTDREMLERALDLSSQELIHANAEMRAIFLALPDTLFTVNKDGVILNCKASRVDDLFFLEETKMIGKRIQDLPSKETGSRLKEALLQVQETNSIVSIEYALPMQGKECFYEARMVPFLEDQTIIIVRNITGKKQGEEALRLSEERYRLLIENANDAIFIAQDGHIRFPNQRTVLLSGYTVEELLSMRSIDFVHPDDRERIRNMVITGMKRGEKVFTGSFRLINKGEKESWIEITAVPIIWDGRPAVINFARDVTEQRQLENRLLHAQKMEAVGALAGGIAHDFNNILMGIQGYASLMLLDVGPDNLHREHLENIEQFVKSGADLTRQLLGFARGGAYQLKTTDLNEMMEKTSSIFGRTKKEITIQIKPQENIWMVETDQGQIEQVLLNLYVNAWQAMPGGGYLFLETENVRLGNEFTKPYGKEPGEYVKMVVTDTGTGMDEKTVQRIFEPFFTTKEMGRGVGLGLASVYGIVKSHKGIIQVRSKLGSGTTFVIYLPVSSGMPVQEKAAPGLIHEGSETILLVDDEKTVIGPTRMILERLGYVVYAAHSGGEAIEIYGSAKDAIDLVILDMIMPGTGGAETFYRLKSIDPGVRVILSSGYSIGEEALAIMKNGGKGFIQKPFRIDQLSEKVREVLREGGSGRHSTQEP